MGDIRNLGIYFLLKRLYLLVGFSYLALGIYLSIRGLILRNLDFLKCVLRDLATWHIQVLTSVYLILISVELKTVVLEAMVPQILVLSYVVVMNQLLVLILILVGVKVLLRVHELILWWILLLCMVIVARITISLEIIVWKIILSRVNLNFFFKKLFRIDCRLNIARIRRLVWMISIRVRPSRVLLGCLII